MPGFIQVSRHLPYLTLPYKWDRRKIEVNDLTYPVLASLSVVI
jgi:hypothetical protein